jgi:hypothetical protein
MPSFSQGISLRPTGADSTYRRLDYVRGSLASIVFAAILLSFSFLAGERSAGAPTYLFFGGMLLGLLGVAAAIIFLVQAAIGSAQPVGFALPPDFVPMKFRDGIRTILVKEWNPLQNESSDVRAYDSYLSLGYMMASRNLEPENIASTLEQIEATDGLVPGSNPAARLNAAEQLLTLLNRRVAGV